MPTPPAQDKAAAQANAHRLRAIEFRKARKFDEALAELNLALQINPNYAAAVFNIAAIRLDQGRADEAAEIWKKAIELKPDYYQAHASLGVALRHLGRLDESIDACRKAISIKPDDLASHQNLALALHAARKYKEATAEFEALLLREPKNPTILNNYANLLAETNRPARAVHAYQLALSVQPQVPQIMINLGNALTTMGETNWAMKCYRSALSEKPDMWEVHSNLLLNLNYDPRSDSGLLQDHLEWARRHAEKFYPAGTQSFPNDRSPGRRLRIGYLSADFRRHSVSYFVEPILLGHDRAGFEVYCYNNVERPDDVTLQLRALADHWRDIVGIADDAVVEMIRRDQIDILVDLSGHTAHHRLLVFARKPAPVQVTYLGYPNTTGLKTIDYRITDAQADPPGMTEALHTETLVRLPNGFLCYKPSESSPGILDAPPSNSDAVRFGSFNYLGKVGPTTMKLWAKVLNALPNSTLLIKADAFGESESRQGFKSSFGEVGGDLSRVELIPRDPSHTAHLALYQKMDIALDTFPYHGTTTTCEAMYMGKPVITMAGHAHVSRVGTSLLNRVGLDELIAKSPDDFVRIAVELAQNTTHRREISGMNLRQRMQASPLMDSAGFVRELEKAYRQMWLTWCKK